MKFSDWLDGGRGRPKTVASHFGVTQSAVTHWRVHGVPPKRMKAVRGLTCGEVSLEEMLPELIGTEGAPAVPGGAAHE